MDNRTEIFMEEWDLSQSQMLLWLGQKMNSDNPLYNAIYLFNISGEVKQEYFIEAFSELIKRIHVLRAVFIEKDGEPRQLIRSASDFEMEFLDISDRLDTTEYIESWVEERKIIPFDITKRLFDSALFKKDEKEYVWYLNVHHLITDGYSTKVYYNEMFNLYKAIASNQLDVLDIPPSYEAFLELEKENRQSEKSKKAGSYWKEKIKDSLPIATLYGKKAEATTTASRRLVLELGLERSALVRKIAKQPEVRSWTEDLSVFNLLTTIFFIFIYRISGEKKLVIGSPSHNRNSESYKNTAGLFIEFFPLTLELSEEDTFMTVLQRIKIETNGYLKNAITGMTSANINRGVQVIFNYITAKLLDVEGFLTESKWVHPGHQDPAHQIRCNVIDMDATGGFKFLFDLNYGVFSDEVMENIPIHFQRLMDSFLEDIHQPVGKPSLSAVDDLLEHENTGSEQLNNYNCISTEIQKIIFKNRKKIALKYNGKDFSYSDLENLSDSLALVLKKRGLSQGDKVGVHLYRSPEYILSLFAILKLGAVFVPIASDQPKDRINYMLEDSGCKLVVTENDLVHKLSDCQIPVVDLKEGQWMLLSDETPFIGVENIAENIAYILYTSGSTGKPKGVEITHGNFSNFLFWASNYWEGDISFALCTSISFDITLTSIFVPLIKGGEIIIYKEDKEGPDTSVVKVLKDNLANTVMVTPSHLTLFQDMCHEDSALYNIIVAGEDFKTDLASKIQKEYGNSTSIYNFYGPTEVTIGSIVSKYDIIKHTGVSVPIGIPIANTTALVLDSYLNLVPKGVIGTLYLGGKGVAKGYINRLDLTEECFIESPFADFETIYNTGDLVRINDDGMYEYFGREDQQVKINGYRIELREIEHVLKRHPDIENAVVVANNVENINEEGGFYSESQLVAFYSGLKNITLKEIEQFSSGKLPVYMMPKALTHLDEFPLTPNGKTDRNALQEAVSAQMWDDMSNPTKINHTSFVVPRNEIEELLANIWLSVLWVDKMGVFENFIEMGGHSLAAIRVTTRINEELEMELPLSKVFEYPTIAQYANYLEETMISLLEEG